MPCANPYTLTLTCKYCCCCCGCTLAIVVYCCAPVALELCTTVSSGAAGAGVGTPAAVFPASCPVAAGTAVSYREEDCRCCCCCTPGAGGAATGAYEAGWYVEVGYACCPALLALAVCAGICWACCCCQLLAAALGPLPLAALGEVATGATEPTLDEFHDWLPPLMYPTVPLGTGAAAAAGRVDVL